MEPSADRYKKESESLRKDYKAAGCLFSLCYAALGITAAVVFKENVGDMAANYMTQTMMTPEGMKTAVEMMKTLHSPDLGHFMETVRTTAEWSTYALAPIFGVAAGKTVEFVAKHDLAGRANRFFQLFGGEAALERKRQALIKRQRKSQKAWNEEERRQGRL